MKLKAVRIWLNGKMVGTDSVLQTRFVFDNLVNGSEVDLILRNDLTVDEIVERLKYFVDDLRRQEKAYEDRRKARIARQLKNHALDDAPID